MAIALIVGCGYLGKTLARQLLERGDTVYGTTRDDQHAAQLAQLGIRPLLVSITQPITHAAMRIAVETPGLDVYYMIPPGRPGPPGISPTPRQTILGGIAHMIKTLRRSNLHRAILVSSTAVYGQSHGQHVDADTPAHPNHQRGQLLLEGERLWLNAQSPHNPYRVVRLAGIYGPGRIIGLSAVRSGAPLLGDPQALINLIHVHDAATLLQAVASSDAASPIELGCDGNPVPRIDYYTHLARLLSVPPPQPMDATIAAIQLGVDANRLRHISSKALDNIPTCQRTGWAPQYPNYRVGLEASL